MTEKKKATIRNATPAEMWRYLSQEQDYATTKIYVLVMMGVGSGSLTARYASESVAAIVVISVAFAMLGVWASRRIINSCIVAARVYGVWDAYRLMEQTLEEREVAASLAEAIARVKQGEEE